MRSITELLFSSSKNSDQLMIKSIYGNNSRGCSLYYLFCVFHVLFLQGLIIDRKSYSNRVEEMLSVYLNIVIA